MITHCPRCWAELATAVTICPACGADLTDDRRDYVDKLIAALHHPEPLTQRRAAYILGLRAEKRAVPALIDILKSPADVYVRAEAACSLGKIGTASARAALQRAEADTQESFLVRRVAAQGMTRQPQCQEDHT